ncbi:MAG: hypothetical protein KGR24_10210, partial [Planctomycetes bacterium]|nr:hypothetical protein [Planctomycetota bacterium]
MFLGAMLWQIALPGGVVPVLRRPAAEIREGWLQGPGGLQGPGEAARSRDANGAKVAQVKS